MRRRTIKLLVWAAAVVLTTSATVPPKRSVNLSPAAWPKGEYERFLAAQGVRRTEAGVAVGRHGAVTVAYNGLAARAGLEALRQGGTAIDAAMTAALTQVALTAGAPISYFGIMSLVYYDAATGKVYTMNAEWNTVRGETEPKSIPGALNMTSEQGMRGTVASGRTALVGGFMKGVGAAHARFGKLPFKALFEPAIHIAETGMPVTAALAEKFRFRGEDLKRLPETRAVFTKAGGSFPAEGEIFRQPALAKTLGAIAAQGTDYMYKGRWARKLVAAVQADGGKMTLDDLAAYDVIWGEPLAGDIGAYRLYTNPAPNAGGARIIEAQKQAIAAGLGGDVHWASSGAALRKVIDATIVRTPAPERPQHSDDVVAVDGAGNMAAITHTINSVDWGKTAIFVDGVSIGDPGSFQQAAIARVKPGGRLPAPTQTGILFKDGKPALAFASMGSGLHYRTFQALLSVTRYGMTVDQAVNAPDFFGAGIDPATKKLKVNLPKGRFPKAVLDEMGYAYEEFDASQARYAGEGIWVAISRDPKTGEMRAASHNRNNSAAVAY